ncbi:type I secretion C-terminal target domain-containing protein [Shinella sp. SUS2]|uniref:type I secretion C-terminal target domain-containing protein n=1 Tax=unclassified Shinella TaxID=2643062 RepID=UPI003528E0C4
MFLFTAKSDSGTNARIRDTITDFSQKGGDKIDLGRIGLDNGNGEDPFFTFLGKGASPARPGNCATRSRAARRGSSAISTAMGWGWGC